MRFTNYASLNLNNYMSMVAVLLNIEKAFDILW